MALGVTTQGPSLRPCISGLRFVSNPMLRMAAASSPNLHRQLSSGESGSWRHESSGESHSGVHHRNSSKLNAKSLVDPRTRKWSVSSKHHLLSGHARGTSISRESFAGNCYSRSDGQQRIPIPGPARGQNADTTDDFVFSQHRDPVFMQAWSWKLPQEESRSNHNEVFQSQSNGKPGACNRVQNSIKCSTPQKLAVHRQESSPKGNYDTPPSYTYPNRKMGSWGFVEKDSNFQHRMEEKDGVDSRSRITPTHLENFGPKRQVMYNRENPHTSRSRITPTHLENFGPKRQVMYNRENPHTSRSRITPTHLENFGPKGQVMYNRENLHTFRSQSHLSRDRRPHARFSDQGLYSYAGSAQKNDVGFKQDIEAWREKTNNYKAMRGPVEGSVQTHCRNVSSDINPSSRTNEVSSMSNQGRDNMPMPTSAVINARAPMQKTDNLSVEESVPVERSTTTETRGKQVGLPNPSLTSLAQDQGLTCQEIRKISSNSQSDSRRNQEKKETPETKGKHIKPNNGSDSSMNESASWCNQEKKVTPETNGKPISDDNGVDSAMNEVRTGVTDSESNNVPEKFNHLYNKIYIVDNVEAAKMVVGKLMGEYKNLIHACDTEVANIDIKKESPVGHGKIICFSIYCGSQADFGNGKSCLWVDVLDRCEDVLSVFAPYFADSSIQKVWHNYSFDKHIIENHGIDVDGFHADTMHLARLWNSDRSRDGGYSLEALTNDPKVMDEAGAENKDDLIKGKESMKSIFGKKKIKKDGTEGKVITLASVQELQTTERVPWICYSALDSISTFSLWKSLKAKLENRKWKFQGGTKGSMYDFYTTYWRPFGDLLAQMESEGMLVDRNYLSEMEKVAVREQEISGSQFREWASTYCSDACYMNVGSDAQVRQLLFGGMCNKKKPTETLPMERTFRVPNVDSFIEEGKKAPLKFRNIVLRGLGKHMEVEAITPSGWPAVSGAALRTLAGKVSVDYDSFLDDNDNELPSDSDEEPAVTSKNVMVKENSVGSEEEIDPSIYGTAYNAFGGGQHGREACQAIGALCEVSSINTLISNFLQPLQGEQISGPDGRVHCSLNINTETGRLSARRPNLQNQPALEKDRYKIRRAFIAAPGNSLVVADYGQLELRILAHLSDCKSMRDAFKAGGDFHSRTAMNMYPHVREAVEKGKVLLEWDPQPGEEKPAVPLLKDLFATERRKAKMLNFSIAYGKTAMGLSKDWKVSETEAMKTVKLWYNERQEVLKWQEERKRDALQKQYVLTLLGRARHFPNMKSAKSSLKGHIERAAINTPVQGSAADVAMCAMLEISRNSQLKKLGWKLLLQVHDEVILEGPTVHAEEAKSLVVKCMSYPFNGKNILSVDLVVDAKCALNWYEGK